MCKLLDLSHLGSSAFREHAAPRAAGPLYVSPASGSPRTRTSPARREVEWQLSLTLTALSLCARHHSKHFLGAASLNPPGGPMWKLK